MGRDVAVLGVVPAGQGFDAIDPPRLHIDLWLIVERQLILLDGLTKLAGQRQVPNGVVIFLIVVECDMRLGLLGGIHRDVGALHQLTAIFRMLRIKGDASANAYL